MKDKTRMILATMILTTLIAFPATVHAQAGGVEPTMTQTRNADGTTTQSVFQDNSTRGIKTERADGIRIVSNTVQRSTRLGGIYVLKSDNAFVSFNTVLHNHASNTQFAGISVWLSNTDTLTIEDNLIAHNNSYSRPAGVYLRTFRDNTINFSRNQIMQNESLDSFCMI